MKKVSTAIISMALSAAIMPMMVGVASADPTVTLTSAPYYSGNGGGEFTATTSINYLGNYAADTQFKGGFETFCVETGVEVVLNSVPPNPYNYTLSSSSVGKGGTALTVGAAYLYEKFALGNLAGYNYSSTLADRQASDELLQAALWFLMGGQTFNTSVYVPPTTANNIFYAAAEALGNADDVYTGTAVQVMNLTDASGAIVQNQLVYVPDGGTTVVLLGIGLMGVVLLSRRFAIAR